MEGKSSGQHTLPSYPKSIRRKLVLIARSMVRADQPLVYPLFRRDGTLLADKGLVLTETQAASITSEDIYTLDFELVTAVHHMQKTASSEKELGDYKLPSAFERLRQVEGIIREIYNDPHHPTNLSKFLTAIGRIQNVCQQSPDAAIAKIFLDNKQNYTVQHLVHSAVLCELIGSFLNWDIDTRRSLSGAAMSMNISLGFMQDELQHQAESLSDEQLDKIAGHPDESASILKKSGITDPRWLEFVSKHHEHADGSGYPKKLSGKDIPIQVSLLRLADIYCAKVTGRSYREPIVPNIAARDIYMSKSETQKTSLIEIFVKSVGLYPPGTLVKLANGEAGLVIRRGQRVDTPYVKAIRNAQNLEIQTPVLRNTATKGYHVVNTIPFDAERTDLNFEPFWN